MRNKTKSFLGDNKEDAEHYKKLLLKYMANIEYQEGIFFLDEDNDWQSELIKLWNANNELQVER